MLCFHPYPLSYSTDTKDGVIRKGWRHNQLVPCGRCGGCRLNRAEQWSNRLLWESENYKNSLFCTLTYTTENIPADNSVNKRELQLFFKRLRKKIDFKFKYFACGEYGETHGRPHYHAVILGLSHIEHESAIKDCWTLGFISVSPFNKSRARYVAGYLLKEVDKTINLLGRNKPFALMSKGMGLDFALKYEEKIKRGDPITINGKPVGIPRYFRKKIGYQPPVDSLKELNTLVNHVSRVGSADYYKLVASFEKSRRQAEKDFEGKNHSKELKIGTL